MVKAGLKKLHSQGAVAPGIEKAYHNRHAACRRRRRRASAAKDGHSSTSSSITPPTAMPAVTEARRWLSSNRTGDSWTSDLADYTGAVTGLVQQCLWRRRAIVRDHSWWLTECRAAMMGHVDKRARAVSIRSVGYRRAGPGAPQWQIEGLRLLEYRAMQKKMRYRTLERSEDRMKSAIFAGNQCRLYEISPQARDARYQRRPVCD